jgi:hypothetical protein
MPVPALLVPDCHTIAKAFERGANYCATEESVFAMMTPMLTAMRANARAFLKMAGAAEAMIPNDDAFVLDSDTATDKPAPLVGTEGVPVAESTDAGVGIPIIDGVGTVGGIDVGGVGTGVNALGPDTMGDPTNPKGAGARKANRPTQKKSSKNPAQKVGNWVKKKTNECIPCEFRIDMAGDLFKKMFEDFKNMGLFYYEYFKRMLQQLIDLLKFWDNDKYAVNLCNLWKFFTEFVCLPDFRRIITMLMALLIQMAIEINSFFDLILMLVAPLLMPFLIAIIAPLEQMLLMIIKPIECIINAIADQIDKLDYSAIFNMQLPQIKIGPLGKKKDQSILKTTTFDSPLAEAAIDKAQSWGVEAKLDPASIFKDHTGKEQEELKLAEIELEKVRQRGGQVDMKDANARKQYQADLEKARAEYSKKSAAQSQTAIQEASAQVRKMTGYLRDAFLWVKKWLDIARQKVTEYINMIFDEIKKLMESFLGSNGQTMLKLFDKLQVVQLIAMIVAIIDFIRKKKSCKEDKDTTSVSAGGAGGRGSGLTGRALGTPLGGKNAKVWTDADGITHIEEDTDALADILNTVVGATGIGHGENLLPSGAGLPTSDASSINPMTGAPIAVGVGTTTGRTGIGGVPPVTGPGGGPNGTGTTGGPGSVGGPGYAPLSAYPFSQRTTPRAKVIGTGSSPLDETRQRVKSLIELTGDPVLDTTIARAIDTITSPVKLQFRCPLQTSVADAEQVNRWIQELSSR